MAGHQSVTEMEPAFLCLLLGKGLVSMCACQDVERQMLAPSTACSEHKEEAL